MAKGYPFILNRIILATGLIIFPVLFVLQIERCHTRMDSSKCVNWRKLGTRIWINSFFPSWINVFDEYTMEWSNKWSPGFMYVGCKPHPIVNERHTICCALTFILWRAQIVEGKDRPTELGKKKWEEPGKTVGLMLRMYEPIFLTVKRNTLTS